jgi:hypothetical protein
VKTAASIPVSLKEAMYGALSAISRESGSLHTITDADRRALADRMWAKMALADDVAAHLDVLTEAVVQLNGACPDAEVREQVAEMLTPFRGKP